MVTVVAIQSAATSEGVAMRVAAGYWTFDTVDLVQAVVKSCEVACGRERQWGGFEVEYGLEVVQQQPV